MLSGTGADTEALLPRPAGIKSCKPCKHSTQLSFSKSMKPANQQHSSKLTRQAETVEMWELQTKRGSVCKNEP